MTDAVFTFYDGDDGSVVYEAGAVGEDSPGPKMTVAVAPSGLFTVYVDEPGDA